ncbi:pyruvoyl-dependent arginine decarboxylase [Nocardioides sp. Leaf285]|uniref:pyruvoyl-dependent arginine decarboxylase n=1 Tax=Nocardioides sp. Leaf285 TaxID=1736322 RepID=UPI000B2B26D2|nr:pyruvoyl-dependent arginine decarboxylase [Nocardioides sp. Leaf285]
MGHDTTLRAGRSGEAAQTLDITVRTGSGSGRTPLSAFDAALQGAGVADFNLVTLSSVIPPGSRVRQVGADLPGGHGDVLFCVRAEAYAERPGETGWAGLGWCVDAEGAGLFVEHHGPTEESVLEQIELSLADMKATRRGHYGAVQTAVASVTCVDLPACAVVLAAYRVSSWFDPAAVTGPLAPTASSAPAGRPSGVAPTVATAPTVPPGVGGGSGSTPGTGAPGVDPGTAAPAGRHDGVAATPLAARPEPTEGRARAAAFAAAPATRPVGRVRPGLTITVEKEVDEATSQRYYRLYRDTFSELETLAAARQLLHEEEFHAEMVDPRVQKWLAWDEAGEAVGMATLTDDLDTVPWISPGFLAERFPDHAARGAVYYLGFTLVAPTHRSARVFHAIIEEMAALMVAERAVAAWDICAFNDDRRLSGNAGRLLSRLAEVSIEPVDLQTYYAGTFHGPKQRSGGRPALAAVRD